MKKLLVILVLTASAGLANAQYALKEGKSQINAGVGLSTWGIPLYIGFDYGAATDVSVGGEVSFRNYNDNFFGVKYRHSIVGISANGNYHLNGITDIPEQFDIYAGLNLGFYIWSSSGDYKGDGSSGIGLGAQLGARYYFNDKAAINLELGGGNAFSGGKFGLTFML